MWQPSPRYPDPAIEVVDPSFEPFRLYSAAVERLATGFRWAEGPVWFGDGRYLLWSDLPNNRVMKWEESTGAVSVFRGPSNFANGNTRDRQGRLVTCEHGGRRVIRTEYDGSITVLADRYQGKRLNSPNDVAVRSDGTLWFTDPSWGLKEKAEIPGHWVFKLDPKSGKVDPVIKDLPMPNGIVFSSDESRLYVADTGGNTRHPDPAFHKLPASIHCYAIDKDGRLGKTIFVIKQGSDGIRLDVKGNLYTTHGNKVHVYNADGKLVGQIEVPENPANLCFGGDDFKTLFITARTSLYSVRVKVAGAKPKGANW